MTELSPDALPPGTVLGPWQVENLVGGGTYGAIYRAHRVETAAPQPVALKLARHANDPRFGREAELLTRLQHPGVPRLLGQGTWNGGRKRAPHPFLVMQWVEGSRLYAWAQQHPLTSPQALRLLAQVARALAATHALQGLHRDVKGDNVLVSPQDQAFLVDFGCGTWAGAASLTDGILAPGTKPYRSPQALRFHWNHRHSNQARYLATPADDVYALGVTAYRLCTGTYPPPATNPSAVGDDGLDTLEALIPPGRLAPLDPALEALILRMLSDNPQDRGSAAELAEAMEAAAATAEPATRPPVRPAPPAAPSEDTSPPDAPSSLRGIWPLVGFPLAAVLLILLSGNLNLAGLRAHPSSLTDGGTGGVADAAVGDPPVPGERMESLPGGLHLDIPKEPLPGQRRPPCLRSQSLIQGGCWIEIKAPPPCEEGAYAWKGACYYPIPAEPRPRTSDKP
ncbi:serine/threonine-protein kinase [Stigmatella aurantiaca]|uniref:Protein kinase n=1 Tax=Stigmatella aurantiaca (strain DW4/3-1) TaxID=378806 RepID=Q091Z8_STIAD|nr:serine/threonine-protein kinase [Stigmatella aurantiaca]ADO75710.1 Protein kinase [Stigmatella aurantiaca DW4/3-1]EAU66560.1 protein kinase [Stigmatella aurantiaca DW4/3-1]